MKTTLKHIDGFRAAEQRHIDFCAAEEAAEGYLFPSNLRQAFATLPAAAQGDFLDAIGALFVNFQVIGEPVPGRQNLREDCRLHSLSPQEQDDWAHEQELLGDREVQA
ncbi:hypothetical protein [Achromobacter deleyi]|uniref:hypothetical protein n=1 Tax=Achromobacter deleyi TaxID=1353891 RepID=UPI001466E30B|nr:hypothetical protein [Achromobacter deleyi]CAB3870745.1 hypothetical protein LMG3412_02741 [Achromobacter deleyi]